MSESTDGREARKQYMRHRQTMVFTTIGAVLVVAMIVSLLFFFHVGGLGKVETAADEPNFGYPAPCVQTEGSDSQVTYLANNAVTVRVLNGTSSTGFAQAVGSALENREFVLQGVDNYSSSDVERTIIRFGKNAIPEAYTLVSNFSDAYLQMDDRTDKLVDVILGASFNNLVDTDDVPKTGSVIPNIEGCVAADQLTDVPKADEHTAV
ncbi:LytR C-terminal domain-containing protein [Bifidobacterium choloepi]|uniref:LytR family transcriptional regulator n=1 Tax=Bifidobacterium choloepi TaxID=2614131 RepID=A0A6I5N2T2_9BIFI|nr:LytR C-terminal domain-containing protein [Bifidobacterium choloepi]NEG69969.1 LytR family transcriptional regulator [Bifidobacterium choloepi]